MNQQGKDYDILLLGSGLGGLIAGAWLARKGYSVLLLKERGYQSSCRRNGYRYTPFSNFSEKCLRPSLVQKISQELRLSFLDENPERDFPIKPDPGKIRGKVPFQIILPKARIDLFTESTFLQREWKREFPDEFAQIEGFYDELGFLQSLLKAKKKKENRPFFPVDNRSFIRKWFPFPFLPEKRTDRRLSSFSNEFNEFIRLQLISSGNLFSDAFPISLAAYLLLPEEGGERVSPVDLESLEDRINDYFLQSGGETEEIEKAERVEKRWKEGFTLTLKGDRRVFQSRWLILNSPLHSFSNLFGKGGKPLSRWLQRIQPRYILFPSFLGVREKVVPVGMRDLLVSILDLEKPYEEGNFLFLTLSRRGDETAAPEGRRALTVQSLVPFRRWEQASMASHQEAVMKHLNHLIPFMGQYLEFTDFEWAHDQIGRWSYPHFLYEIEGPFNWRKGVIPPQLSKDLYFSGKESFPYLGLEGEVLSGLMVAREIDQYSSASI